MNNFEIIIPILNNLPHLNVNTYDKFNDVGSYFKLLTYKHQPVWCSYSLSDLKLGWEQTGGWLLNEKNEVLYFKQLKKYEK